MFKFELLEMGSDGELFRHRIAGLYPTLNEAVEAAENIMSSHACHCGYRVTEIVSKSKLGDTGNGVLRGGSRVQRPD